MTSVEKYVVRQGRSHAGNGQDVLKPQTGLADEASDWPGRFMFIGPRDAHLRLCCCTVVPAVEMGMTCGASTKVIKCWVSPIPCMTYSKCVSGGVRVEYLVSSGLCVGCRRAAGLFNEVGRAVDL